MPFRLAAAALIWFAGLPAPEASAAAGDIRTFAGGGAGDGLPATQATIGTPEGIAFDAYGNLYIADTDHARVRRVDRSGIITTVAGSGASGSSGDGGAATSARLVPTGVAVAADGTIYVADGPGHKVRRVDPSGIITTLAGTGECDLTGDGGPATAASLCGPADVEVDLDGSVLISDTLNCAVRRVRGAIISTVAGTGRCGFGGDGGPASEARLFWPAQLALDGQGRLLIADSFNHRIRRVEGSGTISTVAGTGRRGLPGDGRVAEEGVPAILASLDNPEGVAVDGQGSIFIGDSGTGRVRRVNSFGQIFTVAGGFPDIFPYRNCPIPDDSDEDCIELDPGLTDEGQKATLVPLRSPESVAVDPLGTLYFVEFARYVVRKVDGEGRLWTVAGNRWLSYCCDGEPATVARLAGPGAVATDSLNNVYIADTSNSRVRRVDAEGRISTVAGTGVWGYSGDGGPASFAQITSPEGLAVDQDGNLFFSDLINERVRKVDRSGIISTVAGTGRCGLREENIPATESDLCGPTALAIDAQGNLYILETSRFTVRKVDTAGRITTFAGRGERGFSGDGGPATSARLDFPEGIAADGAGNVYIADTLNSRVRRVDPSGIITTFAGTPDRFCGTGDGGPATAAGFCRAFALATDGRGGLYIADSGNSTVRYVDAAGIISTVAGVGRDGFSGDGGPATSAHLRTPTGVALDARGNLYIGDSGNARVRMVETPRA